jgi:hypothetical protein
MPMILRILAVFVIALLPGGIIFAVVALLVAKARARRQRRERKEAQ